MARTAEVKVAQCSAGVKTLFRPDMRRQKYIIIKTSQVINKFSLKVAQKHATYKPGLVCKYNIQEMELVKGSAHALVYETGLLIGHTHILFYFIFQLLVQKHKISTIKGVSFTCATDVDNLGCP